MTREAGTVHTLRGLEAGDWARWQPLWAGYLAFYRAELSEETTRYAFDRLTGGDSTMFGLLALNEEDEGIGLAHCVVHPATWSEKPSCYLEDLFVAPAARGTDLGRAILEEAKRLSVGRGADRLYWHTQVYNGRARSLYDQVGRPTSFVVYEM
jgi:GNAT superfamily N-acetyltransferase